jgi:hypothetical protein
VSANEIIAELPKLKREDLERVDARVHQLLEGAKELPKKLKPFAGSIRDLPEDMAEHHDHYIHGQPKK